MPGDWQAVKSAAESAYQAQDYAAAASGYRQALDSLQGDPHEAAKLAANLSMSHQKLGMWEAAVGDAQQAVKLAPAWEKAWYRLGTAHLGCGANAKAQAAFSEGLRLKPHNKQLREALQEAMAGGAAASSGTAENRVPPAAAATAKARPSPAQATSFASSGWAAAPPADANGNGSAPPTPESSDAGAAAATVAAGKPAPPSEEATRQLAEAQKALGNDSFKVGRYEEAIRCFSAALQLCPGTPVYLGNRAAACLMARRYREAAQDSLQAVQLDPGFVKGYARAAKAEMLMGAWERAEQLYSQAIQLDTSQGQELLACQIVARKVRAGQEALAGGEPQRAYALAESACQGSLPAAEPAVRLKVEALLACGRHAEAVAEARSLTLGGEAQAPEVLSLRGRALYLCGNMQMAQQLFQQALRRDPDCVPAQRGLKRLRAVAGGKERGNAAFAAGSYQEAYEQYSASLAADPGLKTQFVAQVACNRAAAAAKLGRHEESLADAELAIQLDAAYAKAYVRRAQAHQGLGHWEAAIRDLEKVAELEEGYPGLRDMLRQARLALKKSKRVDYYAILGVEAAADDDAIKKAYRRAALKHHPDKVSEEERGAAEAQFKLVGEAFAVLSDPQQRRRYDAGWSLEEIQQGHSADGGGGGGFPGSYAAMDEEELLAQMFAGRMGGMGGGGGRRYPGGGGYPGGGFPGGGYPGYRPF